MKLQPVSYKFKDGTRTHTGFIAQDCKDAYVPDWAGYIENEGHYGLRYTEFISLNTKAVQELCYQNNELKRTQMSLERQQMSLMRTNMDLTQRILRLEETLGKLKFVLYIILS
jgi:hypothetical protein